MNRHHLAFQIFVSFGLIVATAIMFAGAVGSLFGRPEHLDDTLLPAMALLARDLPGADPAAEVAALGETLHVNLSLFDRSGGLIAAHGRELPAPEVDGPPVQWAFRPGGPPLLAHLPDGRWVGVGVPFHGRPNTRFLFGLGSLLLVAAAGSYVVARRITHRLEVLQRGVAAWGAGELTRRVPVEGKDEVAAVAVVFNQAADKVGALVGAQRRMLASASHELRSPLARLRMALELIDDGDPAQAARIGDAIREVEELDHLVGDLLLTTRAQALGTRTEGVEVDLGALVAEETARVGATATGAGTVRGDPAMLRRAVRNLLENARRHGGPTVTARVDGATIEVEDDGAGVDPNEAERIWEPFYRPAGHREGDGGVGLGLALVREIARHHGGSAEHRPRPGGGSVFSLRLG